MFFTFIFYQILWDVVSIFIFTFSVALFRRFLEILGDSWRFLEIPYGYLLAFI